MDEAGLVRGCREGDRGAQRALYELHVGPIYRLALRLTRNEQDAFDLTQETFVRALLRLEGFDSRCRLRTWLYRVAVNEWLQLHRRRRTEQFHLRALAARRTEVCRSDPADRDVPEVDAALARISDEHRVILLLKYHENLSYDEIAEVLGVPAGTVASRLNRARAELRSALSCRSPGAGEETAARAHPTVEGGGAGTPPLGRGQR